MEKCKNCFPVYVNVENCVCGGYPKKVKNKKYRLCFGKNLIRNFNKTEMLKLSSIVESLIEFYPPRNPRNFGGME